MNNTSDNKMVSIILLSYKNLDGVYETLDSIFIQDYPELEIIISDDGTPEFDDEENKLKKYIDDNKKSNIKSVIFNHLVENQGTVKNINSGIKKSSGGYIKLISSEDVFSDECSISDFVDYMNENNSYIVFGKMRGVTKEGEFKDELLACESDYDLLKSYNLRQQRDRLFARNFLPAPAAFFRRDIFDKCGMFDEDIRLIEDYPYWIKITKKKIKFSYLDKVTILYRLSGVSSSGSFSVGFMEDMFKIYDKYIFPYDKRFGVFQKPYNALKKDGLRFYLEKAKLPQYKKIKKAWVYLRYSPYFIYTRMLDKKIDKKNKKLKKQK